MKKNSILKLCFHFQLIVFSPFFPSPHTHIPPACFLFLAPRQTHAVVDATSSTCENMMPSPAPVRMPPLRLNTVMVPTISIS
jgi:hypothetical protein